MAGAQRMRILDDTRRKPHLEEGVGSLFLAMGHGRGCCCHEEFAEMHFVQCHAVDGIVAAVGPAA